jgi:hypothetical protein
MMYLITYKDEYGREITENELWRYTLSRKGCTSQRLGNCEICGEYVNDVYYQGEEKRFIYRFDDTWLSGKGIFGHKECLIDVRRFDDKKPFLETFLSVSSYRLKQLYVELYRLRRIHGDSFKTMDYATNCWEEMKFLKSGINAATHMLKGTRRKHPEIVMAGAVVFGGLKHWRNHVERMCAFWDHLEGTPELKSLVLNMYKNDPSGFDPSLLEM